MYLLFYTAKLDYFYDLWICLRNGYELDKASQSKPLFIMIEPNVTYLDENYESYSKYLKKRMLKRYNSYKHCKFRFFLKCGLLYEGIKIKSKNIFSPKFLLKYPININFTVQPNNQCRNNIELILAITSPVESFLERYTYRNIYYNFSFIQIFFFTTFSEIDNINRLIQEENEYYGDVIQFDFIGEYYKLPYNMIGSLRWINNHCKNYKYLVLHQIDIFLNIPYYLNHFHSISEVYPVIAAVYKHQKVIHHIPRNIPGMKRWYVTYSAYPGEYWPDYPQGPCIFISEDTVKEVVNASYFVKRIVFMDDIYLGFLLQYSNISQYDIIDHRVSDFLSVKYPSFAYIKRKYLWIHGVSPGNLRFLANNIYNYVQ